MRWLTEQKSQSNQGSTQKINRLVVAVNARFAKWREPIFWLLIGLALDCCFLALRSSPLICDENYHAPQIIAFMSGDLEVSKTITVLPAYHWLMAGFLGLIRATTLAEMRMVTFLGAITVIAPFYLIVRRLQPENRLLRTAQFVFLPILFPLFPLVYTDVWALVFVLWAVERALTGRPTASALAACAAVLFRTPNIFWAAFAWILLACECHTLNWRTPSTFLPILRRTWAYFLVFLGFAVFVGVNGGVASGDKSLQQVQLNLTNVWFLSLLFCLFFLSNCIAQAREIVVYMRRWPARSLVVLSVLFALYLATYTAKHQYNQFSLPFYLRNRLLHWTSADWAHKGLTAIPVLGGLVGLSAAPFLQPRFRWLAPTLIASVVLLPVVEQRYYLPGFALFLALCKPGALGCERANLFFYVVCSAWLVWGVSVDRFFL